MSSERKFQLTDPEAETVLRPFTMLQQLMTEDEGNKEIRKQVDESVKILTNAMKGPSTVTVGGSAVNVQDSITDLLRRV